MENLDEISMFSDEVEETTAVQTEEVATQDSQEEVQVEEPATQTEEQTEQDTAAEEFNLDDINLQEVFGDDFALNTQEEQELPQEKPQDPQMQQVLDALNKMQEPTQDEQSQMTAEEESAVREIYSKFEKLGLIPKGITDEQQQLLDQVSEINNKLSNQEAYENAVKEHESKISSLDAFDKQLSESIENYDSAFMKKVVADISAKNPKAGEQILNNPAKLLELWNKVGAKAQPSKKPTNVVTTKRQSNSFDSSLEEKVMNATASEDEEARFLIDSL